MIGLGSDKNQNKTHFDEGTSESLYYLAIIPPRIAVIVVIAIIVVVVVSVVIVVIVIIAVIVVIVKSKVTH